MLSTRNWLLKLFVAILACCLLMTPSLLPSAQAARGGEAVKVIPGKPSIWTLEQAHYLLASMHETNQGLKLNQLSATALDPNASDSQRIETLRTVLGITASYDAVTGFKNKVATDKYRASLDQYQADHRRLEEQRARREQLYDEQVNLAHDIAQLNSKITLAQADPQNATTMKAMQDQLTEKQAEKAAVDQRVTNLSTEISGLEASTKSYPSPDSVPDATPLPTPPVATDATIDKLAQKLNTAQPRLEASQALDNYIQMQYEIIAKQLTLLRDEVGPDQRLIFLELPSSIYTVPGKANDMLARAQWRITGYSTAIYGSRNSFTGNSQHGAELGYTVYLKDELYPHPTSTTDVPVKDSTQVRVLDMIPAQSSVNVTESYGQDKSVNVAARFAALFGFGSSVNYSRQHQIFEQFLNQEIFATGFGKGDIEFGWTFGPKPGTKQVSPGIRTTYAVLAIPRNAVALKMQAEGFGFNRLDMPPTWTAEDADSRCNKGVYTIDIPNSVADNTTTTGVSIDYTPVQPGQRVTAVLRGFDFSPQIGVLINGNPLPRVLTVAQIYKSESEAPEENPPAPSNSPAPNATATPPPSPDTSQRSKQTPRGNTGIDGSFEYINSKMIILNFSMGVGYEGTPIITIITPEKVWNINQFLAGDNCPSRDNLQNVNLYLDCYTLESLSQWKPMFLAPLALTDIYVAPLRENPKLTKMVIQGRGFREVTVFTINGQQIAVRPVVDPATGRIIRDEYGHEIGSVTYNSSHEYAFIFPTPPQPPTKWVITARHNNGQGMEEVRKEVLAKDTPQAIM